MLFLTRPSETCILGFLSRQRELPCAHADTGLTRGAAADGYVVDHNRVELGRGPETFERAREALRGWAMSRVGWVEVWPMGGPISVGTTVALLARRYGVWSLFACRVVRAVEEHGPVEEFGFAYATLPGHLLDGEEQFAIRWDHRDDSVSYDLLAVSRPASLLARLTYPLVRRSQRRFAADSLRAMDQAVASGQWPVASEEKNR